MYIELLEHITPFHYDLSMQIGGTPLHSASESGHTDVVELLINHDAHIDVPPEVGVMIAHYSHVYSIM